MSAKCPLCGSFGLAVCEEAAKRYADLTTQLAQAKRLREAVVAYLQVKKSWDSRLPELIKLKAALAARGKTKAPSCDDINTFG